MYHIVFDFDGVIGNTFESFAGFITKKRRIPIARSRNLVYKHTFNNRRPNIFKTFVKKFYLKKFSNFLGQQGDLINYEVISEIKKIKHPKYIVSRNDTYILDQLLTENISLFIKIFGYNNAKTKIRALNKISKSNNIDFDKIIFVTDTIGDIKEVSKKIKKDNIIAVSWGFNPRNVLEKCINSDQIIDEPKQLIQKINEITAK